VTLINFPAKCLTSEQVRAIAVIVREHRGKHSNRDPETNGCAVCKFVPDAISGVELLEAGAARNEDPVG
jgi:hypothetical protein